LVGGSSAKADFPFSSFSKADSCGDQGNPWLAGARHHVGIAYSFLGPCGDLGRYSCSHEWLTRLKISFCFFKPMTMQLRASLRLCRYLQGCPAATQLLHYSAEHQSISMIEWFRQRSCLLASRDDTVRPILRCHSCRRSSAVGLCPGFLWCCYGIPTLGDGLKPRLYS
jgi:hypothetical protein